MRCVYVLPTGDGMILEEVAKVLKKKNADGTFVPKGIAMPTCVNPNNIVMHFSPALEDSPTLEEGDIATMCVLMVVLRCVL